MKEIEDQIHALDERRRALDKEIEDLEQEISIIDCNIIIMENNFRTQRDLKLSISATRSNFIAEKITSVMEKIEKERAEAPKLRESLSIELERKMKEWDLVIKKREKIQEKYPTLCFRLCR